jgi:Ca2+/H+ antiporter, TMEM165/GDT1 family
MKRGVKGIMIFGCVIAVAALLSFIVMSLWNMILPAAITGVNTINFWQALGLLILSKILFGGFHGGWKHKRQQWKDKMNAKLQHMTPEQREQFKQDLRNRCRGAWSKNVEGN